MDAEGLDGSAGHLVARPVVVISRQVHFVELGDGRVTQNLAALKKMLDEDRELNCQAMCQSALQAVHPDIIRHRIRKEVESEFEAEMEETAAIVDELQREKDALTQESVGLEARLLAMRRDHASAGAAWRTQLAQLKDELALARACWEGPSGSTPLVSPVGPPSASGKAPPAVQSGGGPTGAARARGSEGPRSKEVVDTVRGEDGAVEKALTGELEKPASSEEICAEIKHDAEGGMTADAIAFELDKPASREEICAEIKHDAEGGMTADALTCELEKPASQEKICAEIKQNAEGGRTADAQTYELEKPASHEKIRAEIKRNAEGGMMADALTGEREKPTTHDKICAETSDDESEQQWQRCLRRVEESMAENRCITCARCFLSRAALSEHISDGTCVRSQSRPC